MFHDITILDLTRHLPGPYATMMLADLGASVIKIEEPMTGDAVRWTPPFLGEFSVLFLQLNHNKKSLTLNLKFPEAVEIFFRLVRQADVVIESFRPGVTARLGLDYPALKPLNPRLIYCSISGYGQDGPYRQRAGHDIDYIARAGLLGLNTDAEGTPVLPPIQIADLASGALLALTGILAALYSREKTGTGKYVDVSMMDGALALLPVAFSRSMAGAPLTVGEKMELTGDLPFYNVYRTADGKFLALGALEPKFWENFCRAIGKPEFARRGGQQFASGAEREAVFTELKAILASRTQADWLQAFEGLEVCCEPVSSMEEVLANPQVIHRRMIREIAHPGLGNVKLLGTPLRISETDMAAYQPAPQLGEHTGEILKTLGFSEEEISKLRSSGTI